MRRTRSAADEPRPAERGLPMTETRPLARNPVLRGLESAGLALMAALIRWPPLRTRVWKHVYESSARPSARSLSVALPTLLDWHLVRTRPTGLVCACDSVGRKLHTLAIANGTFPRRLCGDCRSTRRTTTTTIVLALHKPVGYVTSSKKTATEKKIIYDLIPSQYHHLFPIGRLDKDTSGLLLLTNDGVLADQLMHPRHDHSKSYEALLTKNITAEELKHLSIGEVRIDKQKIRPAVVTRLGGSRVEIVLTEGKNRQIRRMFRSVGNGIKKLRRSKIGQLELRKLNIAEAEHIELDKDQIKAALS